MNPSRLFILRPVGTILLMLAVLLTGLVSYTLLPISALPEVDYPTIQVQTFYPGASPEVMTSAVTAPLERQFGAMPSLNQMSSYSSAGASIITLQFSLDLSLDVAEQEVQAAINAAGNLPAPPIYAKVNPADAPVLTLAVTSATLPLTQVHDLADTRLAQKISQVAGVGLVSISGGQRPAVRVRANPTALVAYGLSLDDLRTTIANINVNIPKGNFDGPQRSYTNGANDQLQDAASYRNAVIAYRNGSPVRLSDVATVVEAAENTALGAWMDITPAVILNVQRQPGANVIAVVDSIKLLLPKLRATLPAAATVTPLTDRTTTIRASVRDVQFQLALAVALVVLVIYLFLRNIPATIIPSLSVPLSLVGTLGIMYLAGFSLDNLSLMALTMATGFVVDDAIVVLENISRHVEAGMNRTAASLLGAREVGFTVVSMSVSLVAVFLPLLLMDGMVGRLFREFAITLSVAVGVSLVVSLTTAPMMCSRLLRPSVPAARQGSRGLVRAGQRCLQWGLSGYERSLRWSLRHPALLLAVLLVTVGLNVYLFATIPKGFIPQQDTGQLIGGIQADQSISLQAMQEKLAQFMAIMREDPAVTSGAGYTGGRQIPVRAAGRHHRRSVCLGPEADGGAAARPGARRRQFRPAAGPGGRPGHRPGHRRPARPAREHDRQHPP